jgi:hypothetical protein
MKESESEVWGTGPTALLLIPDAAVVGVHSCFTYWNVPGSITAHTQLCLRSFVVLLRRSDNRDSTLNKATAASFHIISNSLFSV